MPGGGMPGGGRSQSVRSVTSYEPVPAYRYVPPGFVLNDPALSDSSNWRLQLPPVIARYAPEKLFKLVFVGVAWSAAARLLLGKENWQLGEEMPKGGLEFFCRFVRFWCRLLSSQTLAPKISLRRLPTKLSCKVSRCAG